MTPHRLESLLSRFAGLSIMVIGDFFLDKYLVLDPALDEPSLETGLAARQAVARRCMPGAAGTVMANLHALGVGDLRAVGVTGDDGEGYELRQGLAAMGVRFDGLFKASDWAGPCPTRSSWRIRAHASANSATSSARGTGMRSVRPRVPRPSVVEARTGTRRGSQTKTGRKRPIRRRWKGGVEAFSIPGERAGATAGAAATDQPGLVTSPSARTACC